MQFINLSKAQHGHDEQSRRKIRVEVSVSLQRVAGFQLMLTIIQAMRDFRRRQRALNLTRKRQSSQWARPFLSEEGTHSPTASHEHAHSHDDISTLANLSSGEREVGSPGPSRTLSPHLLQLNNEEQPIGSRSVYCSLKVSPEMVGGKSRHPVSTHGTPAQEEVEDDPNQEHFDAERNTFSRGLRTWHSNIADVFTSPSQIGQMICLFNRCESAPLS